MAARKNILQSARIVAATERVNKLKADYDDLQHQLGDVAAQIGKELLQVREYLQANDDAGAWGRWLKQHVHYTRKTAEKYIRIWDLKKRLGRQFSKFVSIGVECLSRLSVMPDDWLSTLTPNTTLTDPKTNETKPIIDMSSRELDRALDAVQRGKKPSVPIDQRARKQWEQFQTTLAQIRQSHPHLFDLLRGRILGFLQAEFAPVAVDSLNPTRPMG